MLIHSIKPSMSRGAAELQRPAISLLWKRVNVKIYRAEQQQRREQRVIPALRTDKQHLLVLLVEVFDVIAMFRDVQTRPDCLCLL